MNITPQPKPLVVRLPDRMCFKVKRSTGEPVSCSYYDAYCFTDPDTTVDYMSYAEWLEIRQSKNSLTA